MQKTKTQKALISIAAAAATGIAIHFAVFRQSPDTLDVSDALVVGRSFNLLAPQRGLISESRLKPYTYVKHGDLAVVLNQADYDARLRVGINNLQRALIGRLDACFRSAIAESNRQSAEAALKETEAALARATELKNSGFLSPQAVEAQLRARQESRQLLEARRLEAVQMRGQATRQLVLNEEVGRAISELRKLL